jgi:hypothetical protein
MNKLAAAWLAIIWLISGDAWHRAAAALNVQIGKNFTASTYLVDTSSTPPDSDGAIGPNHYVQLINGNFSVWDKATGANLASVSDITFWNNAGVTFNNGALASDPRIIYDRLSQRWFASQVDFARRFSANRFLLAVSTSGDPTGPWKAVAFQADLGGNFADFPTLGLDANGVYLAANLFNSSQSFLGVLLTSIPKADLLLSTPTATNRTSSGAMTMASRGFALQPAINFSPTNPAEAIIATESGGTENDGTNFFPHFILKEFFVTGASNTNATLTATTNISVPSYVVPLDPPQPDGVSPPTLADGDVRFSACVYQIGDTLYAVHNVEVSNRAAIRWYRLRVSDNSFLESGTISDPNLHLFYPSIAANENGYIVIGFNGCSSNSFVSSYAAAGETRHGVTTFGGLILLKAGVANYEVVQSGESRWGDYSAISVDPANSNRFWTIQEFVSSANVYSTQVTELRLSPVIPTLQIASSAGSVTLSWPTNATGFILESTTNLSPNALWLPVGSIITVIGTQNTTTLSAGDKLRFFRLRE